MFVMNYKRKILANNRPEKHLGFTNEDVSVKSYCIQKSNVRMFIVRRNVIYALY